MSRRIQIDGYRLNKAGKLVPEKARLSVSERLRQASSKRIRVMRPGSLRPSVEATRKGTRHDGHA